MKKINKFLIFSILITFFNCEKSTENQISSSININKIKETFYNSSTNVITPEKTAVKFSVLPLNSAEIKYVYNDIINKNFLKQNVEIGFIKGITTYHYDNNSGNFKDSDIFGFSIYDIQDNNQIVHKFYLKEGESFKLKKELKETFMNTESQNFLVWKYKNKDYNSGNITVSRLFNIDDNTHTNRRNTTRNEFNLFVLRHKYPKSNFLQKNSISIYEDAGLADCRSGCSESGIGTCDGGYYCNPSGGGGGQICKAPSVQNESIQQSLVTENEATNLFNLNLHRQLRDEFLAENSLGLKHIDYYYGISEFILISDYNTSTFIKMIQTLPSLNQSISKLLDNNIESDIIINENLNNDLNSIINDYKVISENPDFQFILNDIKQDIDRITNKSENDLILEFQ
ncbi:hypothetical protein [Polaribacter sp.]|uniref:hypothetical protein n=1 Tax=Polaribacter sp. TaxID=1920175 RepID=UPI003F6C39AC